jgi:hypothetical protein
MGNLHIRFRSHDGAIQVGRRQPTIMLLIGQGMRPSAFTTCGSVMGNVQCTNPIKPELIGPTIQKARVRSDLLQCPLVLL